MLQYQLGWDPAYSRISLGYLAMRWSIENAMKRGFARYDFLPGDYSYKREWCEQVRYVADLECFHYLRPRAVLFQLLRSLKRHVAKPTLTPA
jgi:CelD/BcsL family acetyltransferase involved in cellulose biosynthesis